MHPAAASTHTLAFTQTPDSDTTSASTSTADPFLVCRSDHRGQGERGTSNHGLVDVLLWADQDGEFLGQDGFASRTCGECDRQAVVKTSGQYRCVPHLPAGLTVPWWLSRCISR
jgi:hypothetical protein